MNPGHAQILHGSPPAASPFVPWNPFTLRQGQEFWLVEAPAKYQTVYYRLIFTITTSNISILYKGEDTGFRGEITTQGITAGEWGIRNWPEELHEITEEELHERAEKS